MRWTAPLLLLLAPLAAAQTTPDPTPPASYSPLGVGSEWVYVTHSAYDRDRPDDELYRRDRVAEAVAVGGVEYAVVVREEASQSVPAWFGAGRDTVRFDPERAVVVRLEGGAEAVRSCPLDAAFGATVACDVDGGPASVTVAGGLGEGWFSREPGARKQFVPADPGAPAPVYEAGVGFVGFGDGGFDPYLFNDRPALYSAVVVGPDGERTRYGAREPFRSVRDVEADPTPPTLYYPLHVGFVREEFRSDGVVGAWHHRFEIRADSVVDGQTYAVEWRSGRVFAGYVAFPRDVPARLPDSTDWGEGTVRLLRYDPASTRVLALAEGGGEEPVTPPLGAAFGTLVALDDDPRPLPDGRAADFVVGGRLDEDVEVGQAAVRSKAVKWFRPVPLYDREGYPAPDLYGARVGPLPVLTHGGSCPGCFYRVT